MLGPHLLCLSSQTEDDRLLSVAFPVAITELGRGVKTDTWARQVSQSRDQLSEAHSKEKPGSQGESRSLESLSRP